MVDTEQVLHYQQKLHYEIDSWDLYTALQNQENVVVIDARAASAYQKEHIPNAINFPHKTMDQESTRKLLNFSTVYVTYCDGIGCNASTKGALKLAQLGYKVKELIGGIDWWKRDQYPTHGDNACNISTNDSDCGCG